MNQFIYKQTYWFSFHWSTEIISKLWSPCIFHPNFIKFNLNISYPPPYQRLIRDYKRADSEKVMKALDSVNWERLFNKKNVDAQVAVFNETILNVFCNYLPSKYIAIDHKNPVRMNETIKLKTKTKNSMYNKYI